MIVLNERLWHKVNGLPWHSSEEFYKRQETSQKLRESLRESLLYQLTALNSDQIYNYRGMDYEET